MEFSEVVRKRRMVRRYQAGRPVPEAALAALFDAATRAPSAGFSQGWDFVVLQTDEERGRFWSATTAGTAATAPDRWLTGVQSAPCLILACANKQAYLDRYAEPDKGWTDRNEERWPIPYWDVDTGMASLLILLTAVDQGLGALFFGVPGDRVAAVKDTFAIPADRRLVGAIAVGYPAPDRRSPSLRRGKRTAAQVVHWGGFGRGGFGRGGPEPQS